MMWRYGDNFARSTQAIRYGEEIRLGDVTVKSTARAPAPADGAAEPQQRRTAAPGDYKDAADPDLRTVRVVPATSSSPRRRSACRCFADGHAADEVRSCWRRSHSFLNARTSSVPIRSARRNA